MATLVFDIETVPEPWDSFDAYTKRQLLRGAHGVDEKDLQAQLGLSPLTGRIVSIALYDVERRQGAVYLVSETTYLNDLESEFAVKVRTEKELLEDFWEGLQSYDIFVTFNGRAFDVPFLLHRSAALGVRPTHAFRQSRYLTKQSFPYHVDLMDEFSMYGAMSKRPSLHLLLRAYGCESHKGEIDGSQVEELFRQKKFRDLVKHNSDDVLATVELYNIWRRLLAPESFVQAVEF